MTKLIVKYLKITVLLIFLVFLSLDKKPIDFDLNGKVKSVNSFKAEFKESFGEYKQKEFVQYSNKNSELYNYKFNDKGLLSEYVIYDKYGNKKYVYKNNYKGEYVQSVDIYSTYGTLTNKQIFKYDKNNYVIEDAFYRANGNLIDKYVFERDKSGNVIKKSLFNSSGSLKTKWTYEYDDNNNRTKMIWYDKYENIEKVYKYNFNSNNELIEINIYDSKGNLKTLEKNTYKDGKKILVEIYDNSKTLNSVIKYKYDKDNNWIEKKRIKITEKFGEKVEEPVYIYKRDIKYY